DGRARNREESAISRPSSGPGRRSVSCLVFSLSCSDIRCTPPVVANGRLERMQALLGAVSALGCRSLSVVRTGVRKRSIDDIESDVKGRTKRSKGKKGNASLCKLFKGRRLLPLPQA